MLITLRLNNFVVYYSYHLRNETIMEDKRIFEPVMIFGNLVKVIKRTETNDEKPEIDTPAEKKRGDIKDKASQDDKLQD